MFKYIHKILTLMLIILLLPAIASAAELKDVVDNLQQRYEKVKDYQADFSQEAVLKLGQTTEKAFGKIYIKKPDMMRWDYDKPRRQQIIINKSEIIIYVPDEKQVMKDRAPQGSLNITNVSFSDIKIDAGIKDSLFAFKIPKGVEVIERPKK